MNDTIESQKTLLERCLKSRTSHRWREKPYITQRGIISSFSLSFFSMNALVFSFYFRGSCDRRAASIGCVPRNTRPLWNTVFLFLSLAFVSLLSFSHSFSFLPAFWTCSIRSYTLSEFSSSVWLVWIICEHGRKGQVMSICAVTVTLGWQLICSVPPWPVPCRYSRTFRGHKNYSKYIPVTQKIK